MGRGILAKEQRRHDAGPLRSGRRPSGQR
jgi:hypothetical protein